MKAKEANKYARYYVSEAVGCEIVDENYTCEAGSVDLIFKEDNTLVFAFVNGRNGSMLPDEKINSSDRVKFELVAFSYLTSHDIESCSIRCDTINMAMQTEGKLLLCHHRDALANMSEPKIDRSSESKKLLSDKQSQHKKQGDQRKGKASKAQAR